MRKTAVLLMASLTGFSGSLLAQPNYQGGGDIYHQLQVMQDEIRELRGIVEQQSYEIRQLKQRQIDDYQDLDSRLSGVGSTAGQTSADPIMAAAGGAQSASPGGQVSTAASAPAGNPAAEEASYNAAFELLKSRKMAEAVAAFNAHIERYPSGQYTANAYYWLGEIFLLQNELGKAEQSFSRVVNGFANDRKAPDAMFKLGRVYHLQGKNDQARAMLERAAATDTSAAALARSYLQENF